MTPEQRIRAEARAEAFADAAAVMIAAGKDGQQLLTPEDWKRASYTFSNQKYLIDKKLAEFDAARNTD